MGSGLEGSGAGLGVEEGAAAWPQAPAAPSAPPGAAPGGKCLLPLSWKTGSSGVRETLNLQQGGQSPSGLGVVGVRHSPVGIEAPRGLWVLLPGSQVRLLQSILRSLQLPQPLRHNRGRVPTPACPLLPLLIPGLGTGMGLTYLELLPGCRAPCLDPAFEGFHLEEEGLSLALLEPPTTASLHVSPSSGACLCLQLLGLSCQSLSQLGP